MLSLRETGSLVPRPLPDFISQPWRKIGRRPGIKTTSQTGNGGLGWYVTWTRFVLTKFTISDPWRTFDPRPSPDFSPRLRNKIWEWPGDEARRQVVWDSPHCYGTAGMTTFCGTVCLTGSSPSTTTEGSERWHLWSSFCCCSSLSALATTLSDGLCTLKDSWSWWVIEERLINCEWFSF